MRKALFFVFALFATTALAAPTIVINTTSPLAVKMVSPTPTAQMQYCSMTTGGYKCDGIRHTVSVPTWYAKVNVTYSGVDRPCALAIVEDAGMLPPGNQLGYGGGIWGSSANPLSGTRDIVVGNQEYPALPGVFGGPGFSGTPGGPGTYVVHASLCDGVSAPLTINVTQ